MLSHERFELELMLQRGVKFEIEALSVQSLSFLSEEYIPSKIQSCLQAFNGVGHTCDFPVSLCSNGCVESRCTYTFSNSRNNNL